MTVFRPLQRPLLPLPLSWSRHRPSRRLPRAPRRVRARGAPRDRRVDPGGRGHQDARPRVARSPLVAALLAYDALDESCTGLLKVRPRPGVPGAADPMPARSSSLSTTTSACPTRTERRGSARPARAARATVPTSWVSSGEASAPLAAAVVDGAGPRCPTAPILGPRRWSQMGHRSARVIGPGSSSSSARWPGRSSRRRPRKNASSRSRGR